MAILPTAVDSEGDDDRAHRAAMLALIERLRAREAASRRTLNPNSFAVARFREPQPSGVIPLW